VELICKNCGGPRDKGRRLCRPCDLERLKAIAVGRPYYKWDKECIACGCSYKAWRKRQKICSPCYKELVRLKCLQTSTNKYKHRSKHRLEHREIARELLGRNLSKNEVIHHIDGDPKNNSLDNLMLMSRTDHNRLHQNLDLERLIFEKSKKEDSTALWEDLLVTLSMKWLMDTGVEFLILSKVNQQDSF
jgi:hypothetical protein